MAHDVLDSGGGRALDSEPARWRRYAAAGIAALLGLTLGAAVGWWRAAEQRDRAERSAVRMSVEVAGLEPRPDAGTGVVRLGFRLRNAGPRPITVSGLAVESPNLLSVRDPAPSRPFRIAPGAVSAALTAFYRCIGASSVRPVVSVEVATEDGKRQRRTRTVEAVDERYGEFTNLCSSLREATERGPQLFTAVDQVEMTGTGITAVLRLQVSLSGDPGTVVSRVEMPGPAFRIGRVRGLPVTLNQGKPAAVSLDLDVADCDRARRLRGADLRLRWSVPPGAESPADVTWRDPHGEIPAMPPDTVLNVVHFVQQRC